ncbi:hypothetical protein QQF64_020469 [Cirrhinus molitorella]|uniref:ribonuclease H n=1 Tax=Cirrhinus molitorella TaxID=172907 RepID=A0ABR3LCP5_9TELE
MRQLELDAMRIVGGSAAPPDLPRVVTAAVGTSPHLSSTPTVSPVSVPSVAKRVIRFTRAQSGKAVEQVDLNDPLVEHVLTDDEQNCVSEMKKNDVRDSVKVSKNLLGSFNSLDLPISRAQIIAAQKDDLSLSKPNQVIARAPLSPIPVVGEAFEEVLVDCVGPLPKTKAGCDMKADEDGLLLRNTPQQCGRLDNSAILANLPSHLCNLPAEKMHDVVKLVTSFPSLFSDVPSQTNAMRHDIDVQNAKPIKQHAYRVNAVKRAVMKKETDYLVENGLARYSCSSWSSPCLLVNKPDGSVRFCMDYRRVNAVTVPDSYPLPRMEDCVDSIGSAKFVSKLDLLKGYWQVPLTQRASDISAFVTPDCFMQYNVMAFGMRNAPATFQRLIQTVLAGVPHSKCVFGQATVTYLGRQVGQGQVKPVEAKVAAITEFPTPVTRRELRRFLGMETLGLVASPVIHLERDDWRGWRDGAVL